MHGDTCLHDAIGGNNVHRFHYANCTIDIALRNGNVSCIKYVKDDWSAFTTEEQCSLLRVNRNGYEWLDAPKHVAVGTTGVTEWFAYIPGDTSFIPKWMVEAQHYKAPVYGKNWKLLGEAHYFYITTREEILAQAAEAPEVLKRYQVTQ
jgi:hypothetical protein